MVNISDGSSEYVSTCGVKQAIRKDIKQSNLNYLPQKYIFFFYTCATCSELISTTVEKPIYGENYSFFRYVFPLLEKVPTRLYLWNYQSCRSMFNIFLMGLYNVFAKITLLFRFFLTFWKLLYFTLKCPMNKTIMNLSYI